MLLWGTRKAKNQCASKLILAPNYHSRQCQQHVTWRRKEWCWECCCYCGHDEGWWLSMLKYLSHGYYRESFSLLLLEIATEMLVTPLQLQLLERKQNTWPVLRPLFYCMCRVTVGASDIVDNFAGFSNWGPCVDIIAPVSWNNIEPAFVTIVLIGSEYWVCLDKMAD